MIKDNQMNLNELTKRKNFKCRNGVTHIYAKHVELYDLYSNLEALYNDSGYGCLVLKANESVKEFFYDSGIHYCGFVSEFEDKTLFPPREDIYDELINPETKLGFVILSQNNQFYCVDVYHNKSREDYEIESSEWLNFENVRKIKKTSVYDLLGEKPSSYKRVIRNNQLNLEYPCSYLEWEFLTMYNLTPYDDLYNCIKFDYNLKRLLADSNIALLQFVEINEKHYYIACQYNEYYKIHVDYMENSQDVKWLNFYFCSKLTKEELKTFKEQAEKNGLW